MKLIPIQEIHIEPDRQRKHFDMVKIVELANSIRNLGLLQPLVVDSRGYLVAGERRLRAITHLYSLGQKIRCNGAPVPKGFVPTLCFDRTDELDLAEAQLDENIRREDLTWQERAAAIDLLHRLRSRANPDQTASDTAREAFPSGSGTGADFTRDSLRVAKHLENPEIAKAPTIKDAVKILRKQEEKTRLAALAEKIDVAKLSDLHRLVLGPWHSAAIEPGSVDVILTDPPYGMGADSFKDGGGAVEVLHSYDDVGGEDWEKMMEAFSIFSYEVTKPKAHLYVFCDIDKFFFLRTTFSAAGWRVHRTPIVYAKSHASSRRVPWPSSGPRRSWELILYAVKGDRNVNVVASDVVGPFATDNQLGHAAQKPVELYVELLRRSVAPGNVVLDAFAGTGPVFPAAHELKCQAIGCEIDPAFQGICAERIQKLKEE